MRGDMERERVGEGELGSCGPTPPPLPPPPTTLHRRQGDVAVLGMFTGRGSRGTTPFCFPLLFLLPSAPTWANALLREGAAIIEDWTVMVKNNVFVVILIL